MQRFLKPSVCSVIIACALLPVWAMAQEPTRSEQQHTITGTVVSSTRETLVVRTETNDFHLFVFDRATVKPRSIAVGSRVSVVSTPGEEPGVRLATSVVALETPTPGAAPPQTQPIPPAVRNLERDIQRQVRRWRAGVRAGAALDPELLLFGVHAQAGPLFHREVSFRPNAEFAFGEVTNLIALNLEAVFRLPISPRQGRWSAYVGAGPAFTFLHQNFERTEGEGRDIDFGEFNFDSGFNILTGVQFRTGTFFEVKSSVYSRPAPSLRLIFGYNF